MSEMSERIEKLRQENAERGNEMLEGSTGGSIKDVTRLHAIPKHREEPPLDKFIGNGRTGNEPVAKEFLRALDKHEWSGPVYVTAELRERWLAPDDRIHDRKEKPNLIKRYMDMLRNGLWKYNGEPVIFVRLIDRDNELVRINGQQRLVSSRRTGVDFVTQVTILRMTLSEAQEIMPSIDSSPGRSKSDRREIDSGLHGRKLTLYSKFCESAVIYDTQIKNIGQPGARSLYTNLNPLRAHEIEERYAPYLPVFERIFAEPKKASLSPASMRMGVMSLLFHWPVEELIVDGRDSLPVRFLRDVVHGFSGTSNPARTLRDEMVKGFTAAKTAPAPDGLRIDYGNQAFPEYVYMVTALGYGHYIADEKWDTIMPTNGVRGWYAYLAALSQRAGRNVAIHSPFPKGF